MTWRILYCINEDTAVIYDHVTSHPFMLVYESHLHSAEDRAEAFLRWMEAHDIDPDTQGDMRIEFGRWVDEHE